MNHGAGSLEELVENLVKTWEMEATHKIDYDQVCGFFGSNWRIFLIFFHIKEDGLKYLISICNFFSH